ncbi:MAG: DUF3567 family protein [Betaproteobacteria bacterium]|nr:DUF3567 family protein [Betaproteobacteria bacterium]
MQIVFNDPVLYIVDYPAQDAVEVIDKRHGLGALLRDEAARRFRREFRSLLDSDGEGEAYDDFLTRYQALLTQPAVYH